MAHAEQADCYVRRLLDDGISAPRCRSRSDDLDAVGGQNVVVDLAARLNGEEKEERRDVGVTRVTVRY
jgi:hypothetical protein